MTSWGHNSSPRKTPVNYWIEFCVWKWSVDQRNNFFSSWTPQDLISGLKFSEHARAVHLRLRASFSFLGHREPTAADTSCSHCEACAPGANPLFNWKLGWACFLGNLILLKQLYLPLRKNKWICSSSLTCICPSAATQAVQKADLALFVRLFKHPWGGWGRGALTLCSI